MPIKEEPLQQRVEKVRKDDMHFDLENTDFVEYFKHKKEGKPKKQPKKSKKNKKQKDLLLETMPNKTETAEEIKSEKKN